MKLVHDKKKGYGAQVATGHGTLSGYVHGQKQKAPVYLGAQ